jgi:hypothetical protein
VTAVVPLPTTVSTRRDGHVVGPERAKILSDLQVSVASYFDIVSLMGRFAAGASANPGSSVQSWTVLDRATEPTERVLSVQLCTESYSVMYDTVQSCTERYRVLATLSKTIQSIG